jgi:ankyrin repeat protein
MGVCRFLLQDYDKRTPMHVAASEGKLEVLKLLVSKGGDVNPEDRWQRTPLSDALEHRHQEVRMQTPVLRCRLVTR